MPIPVTFKGKLNHLEIRIQKDTPLPAISAAIINKFESRRNFFEGTSCVYIVGELDGETRVALSNLLKRNYGILDVEFQGVPRAARRVITPERKLFMEFDDAPSVDNAAAMRAKAKSKRFKKARLRSIMQR